MYAVRYDYGYEYLDRSGALLNSILKEDGGWSNVAASAKGTELHHVDGIILSFSSEQYGLSLMKTVDGDPLKQQDIENFAEKIKNASSIIISEFKIKTEQIRRAGSRLIYYIPFKNHEEASDWLLEANIINITKADLFEGELFSPSFNVRWKGGLFTYALRVEIYETRAQIDVGEGLLSIRASQQSSKQKKLLFEQQKVRHRMRVNPDYFVSVDFDLYIEDKEITRDLMFELPAKSVKESDVALKKLFE